ncbi:MULTISPECIES: benzoate 1,2-dioxygenase small subunit [Citrobacter]|uniref:Benzoate 1,2-dioxygenase small subunit n=1 Tax=Citrobacter telavivensis TaxID=2653932 RepID=A0A6L5E7K8_9ENTR|nr:MULTISPECIES: benzoate 1,2-dioxygenase small subunit [Citrobacter]MPQ50568.1 benzoate 1,2-dioxygenase small subunit [Citrobacter telavivensis]QFS71835.1 benzoate 1,2-dioxygenase small subunit [Citrobacter telavivensis]CAI9396540.1 2-halobenzoate 1,2-dioxygenase small subunit [Citrobacter sp. T1.2D-1]
MLTLEQVRQFLYYEARLLDDRQWDAWLHCYSPKVVFWMPAWGDDDKTTRDPQREISLIYYPSRDGLEDRVYRIKTERSGASTPEPRTTHMIGNIELLGEKEGGVEVRYNWVTYSHRYQHTDAYFGTTHCTLVEEGDQPLITRKTVRLNNDYIRQVIDVYHI